MERCARLARGCVTSLEVFPGPADHASGFCSPFSGADARGSHSAVQQRALSLLRGEGPSQGHGVSLQQSSEPCLLPLLQPLDQLLPSAIPCPQKYLGPGGGGRAFCLPWWPWPP